jgi:16S rRNA (uracil1498-N3)-methyltransferase
VHPRFYAPDALTPGDAVALRGEEAQHLTRVLRLKPGDAVRVFNGRGGEFDGVIEQAEKSRATVRIGRPREAAREARVAVTLAQAVLKGEKMDDVVRDAVMMGAAAVQPVVSARSEVRLAALERGRKRERWERIAIASAKQCGRAVVPPMLAPLSFDKALTAGSPRVSDTLVVMLVEPEAAAHAVAIGALDAVPPSSAVVFIGPEGGWTPDEIEAGSQHGRLVTLGPRTLRADAMATVALAVLFSRWNEL